jgi:hypothetical protein
MTLLDERYYQQVRPNAISERLLILARSRIFRDFKARMRPEPSDQLLDVGVSDVINNGANLLEREYPFRNNITACGLGEAREFKDHFPECNYAQITPNKELPFGEKEFDISTSNAVLEHVGSFENQIFFLKELCRVAKRTFISVPNRYFPVEHHTSIPLLHFGNKTFKLACSLSNRTEWSQQENLILMTRKRLRQLTANLRRNTVVGYTGLRMGPFSSNIFVSLD